jgi:hypothetical protein
MVAASTAALAGSKNRRRRMESIDVRIAYSTIRSG